ncbi:MAG: cell wall surface anchor family protein, partial [Candidatus Kaiserbacteria bacterium]|nr:cell wall surface anchor family protein [Candidatus Kaiserbacteria bacterium]
MCITAKLWLFQMLQLLQTMKSLYIFKRANFIGTISVLLLLFPALTFAVSYTPGQTLDPSCSPSDPTCLVINTTITAANINATSTTATSTFAGYVNIGGTGSSILNINNTSAINPFEIHSANAQGLLLYTHSDTGFRGAAISLFKSRGTQASPTAVQAGDIFSYFNSGGYDGAAYVSGSAIEPVAAENWTTGTHGTNLTFWTNSVGTLTFAQRMILSANGKLGIGTTTPWAQLSVTATSNASFPQFVVASSTAVSFIVDQSGNVGIGTSSPSSLLTVSASNPTASYDLPNNALIFGSPFRPASLSQTNFSTAPASGSYTAHLYDTQLTYTSNTGGVNYGIVNNVIDPTSVSANVPSMTGIISYVTHLGSGTVASFLQGSQSVAVNKSPTTISTIIGANNQALNSGVSGATSTIAEGSQSLLSNASPYGLIGTGYAVRLLVQNANANATINTAYGLALDSFTNTGTIGSTYGVYVGNVTAGTQTNHPYSFYALDSSAWNYFGGAVGIGTSTPTAQLSTTGTVRFSNFGAGTLTTDASGNLSVSSDE